MTKLGAYAAAIAVLTLGAWGPIAQADSTEAMCEVHKQGDLRKGASGPCDFSQRQGYVSINLRNGDRFELSPGNKPDHFKDQEGKQVKRMSSGNSHTYQWENKKIIVTFDSGAYAAGGQSAHSGQNVNGAETACMTAVNSNYGGRLKSLNVVRTDASQSGIEVIMDADGERWHCQASNDGRVQDLRVQEGHKTGSGHGSEWDRGCSDARIGSYDRSKHSQAYEDGWQACKK